MKKILLTLFLASSNSFGGILGTLVPNGLFLGAPVASVWVYNSFEKTLNKHFALVADQKTLNFLHAEASKITDKNIQFYTGSNYIVTSDQVETVSVKDKYILIDQSCYEPLKAILNKDVLSQEEEMYLNMFRFLIQREASHIEKSAYKLSIPVIIGTALSQVVLYNVLKKSLSLIVPKDYHTVANSVLCTSLLVAGAVLQSIFSKKIEIKADCSVKGEGALRGGKEYCKKWMDHLEKNPYMSFQKKLNFVQPSYKDRLKALEALG